MDTVGEEREGGTGRVALTYWHHHVLNREPVTPLCVAQGAQLGAARILEGSGGGRRLRREGLTALYGRNQHNVVS